MSVERDQANRVDVHYAVLDTLVTYCSRVDDGDLDGVLELFTKDCLVDYGLGGPRTGHSELAPLLASLRHDCLATSHHVSNVIVEPAGERSACATAYVVAWHQLEDQQLLVLGRYLDRLQRHQDRWRITERRLLVHGGGPNLPSFPRLERTVSDRP